MIDVRYGLMMDRYMQETDTNPKSMLNCCVVYKQTREEAPNGRLTPHERLEYVDFNVIPYTFSSTSNPKGYAVVLKHMGHSTIIPPTDFLLQYF